MFFLEKLFNVLRIFNDSYIVRKINVFLFIAFIFTFKLLRPGIVN